MPWEILIIPLIALVVWIFGTLFKSEDDKTKRVVGRRANVPSRAPGRRVVTDLDRFLEEARRRREPEERRAPPPPPPPRPATARPPVRERPPQQRETPRRPAPVVVKEEVLVALPAPRPVEAPPLLAEAVANAPPTVEASPPPPLLATNRRPSPVAQQLRSLLSKPQTAASAFVLREIFDRPLCKRRR